MLVISLPIREMRLLRFLSIRLCLRLLNPNNYRFLVCKSEKISQKLRGLFVCSSAPKLQSWPQNQTITCHEKSSDNPERPAAVRRRGDGDRPEEDAFAQGRTPRSPRKTPCGTHCELREDDGLAGSLAQLPVQSPDDAAPAGGPHATRLSTPRST